MWRDPKCYGDHGCDVLAFSEKAQLAMTAQFALAALFLCVGKQNQLC